MFTELFFSALLCFELLFTTLLFDELYFTELLSAELCFTANMENEILFYQSRFFSYRKNNFERKIVNWEMEASILF